jgi:predicted nucleic acid-binding protein
MTAAEIFFDTNILLCLMSSDTVKADRAEDLVARGGTINVQVLNEFASTATRKLGMRIEEVRQILSTIRRVCTVKVLDIETHDLGLDLVERYRFALYDGLIVAAAIRAKCRRLYTEDLQHGQTIAGLAICNPFMR